MRETKNLSSDCNLRGASLLRSRCSYLACLFLLTMLVMGCATLLYGSGYLGFELRNIGKSEATDIAAYYVGSDFTHDENGQRAGVGSSYAFMRAESLPTEIRFEGRAADGEIFTARFPMQYPRGFRPYYTDYMVHYDGDTKKVWLTVKYQKSHRSRYVLLEGYDNILGE